MKCLDSNASAAKQNINVFWRMAISKFFKCVKFWWQNYKKGNFLCIQVDPDRWQEPSLDIHLTRSKHTCFVWPPFLRYCHLLGVHKVLRTNSVNWSLLIRREIYKNTYRHTMYSELAIRRHRLQTLTSTAPLACTYSVGSLAEEAGSALSWSETISTQVKYHAWNWAEHFILLCVHFVRIKWYVIFV